MSNYSNYLSNKKLLLPVIVFFLLNFVFPVVDTFAQRRDHLTAEEIEIVRDVQEIDKRMLVFSKAIQRRFIVLLGPDKLAEKEKKQLAKDEEIWGELPKGTQTQMLSDIDKIIDEAVSKIEDVAERDMKSKIFPVAVHVLADNAKVIIPRLEKIAENSSNRRDISLINSAVKNCNLIIEASAKIPRPDEKFMNKRTKKIGHTVNPFPTN
jgi:hypothetical protein